MYYASVQPSFQPGDLGTLIKCSVLILLLIYE